MMIWCMGWKAGSQRGKLQSPQRFANFRPARMNRVWCFQFCDPERRLVVAVALGAQQATPKPFRGPEEARRTHPRSRRDRDHRCTRASMTPRSTVPSTPAPAQSQSGLRQCAPVQVDRPGSCKVSGMNAGSFSTTAASRASRRHRKSKLGCSPCRRATADTDATVLSASAKIASFSSRDHERRVLATTSCNG